MSFQEFCQNGSFLKVGFNQSVEGIVVDPHFYSNQLDHLQRTSLGILFFFLAAVSIVSNGLALLTIYKRKLQILYKCCVVSQCVADLLMAVFVGVNSLSNFIEDTIDWKFGAFMCGWMPYVTTWCALLSSVILTCIAIDRYQGVVLLAGKWDPKFSTSICVIGSLWVIAAGTTVPSFLSYNLKPACFVDGAKNTSEFAHLCLTNKTISGHYYVTIFTFIFLPLLLAFLVLYGVIAKLIWSKKQLAKGQLSASTSTIETTIDSQHDLTSKHLPRTKRSHSQKKVRTFTIILIIMGTFIVCRLPQWIFLVINMFPGSRLTGNTWWVVKYLFSALSLSNTTINPFIYSFLNEMVHLKSNLASGLKNLKNLRINLVSASGDASKNTTKPT